MNHIKSKLIILNFLIFAVWGSYLTSMGNYLAQVNLGPYIFWFYTVQGIVSLFMPMIMGTLADRHINPRNLLCICQAMSAIFKCGAFVYCLTATEISFVPLFILFSLGVAFFIPSIGISNALTLYLLSNNSNDTAKSFPQVRIFGTIGFIAAMLIVNFVKIDNMSLQQTPWQLALSALFGLITAIYTFTLPNSTDENITSATTKKSSGYIRLLSERKILIFLIFTFLISVCLQITNSYANVFISSFSKIDQYVASWGAENANALISLSQISETLCVLLVPVALRRFGIKGTVVFAAVAWTLRFGLLGIGNPGQGVIWFILSMIAYGIAFDFINIAGAIWLDSVADKKSKNRVQSLFMLVMSGLGATIGTPIAGIVINRFVYNSASISEQLSGWQTSWLIFAGYAMFIAILAYILFPSYPRRQ